MSNTVSKIRSNATLISLHDNQRFSPTRSDRPEEGRGTFWEAVRETRPDVRTVQPGLSAQQHRQARRRVFHHLVQSTLNDPQHPYSRLEAAVKQDMINAITDELVNSHYKT